MVQGARSAIVSLTREQQDRGRHNVRRVDDASVHPPGNLHGRHEEQLRDHSQGREHDLHRDHCTDGRACNRQDYRLKLQGCAHLHGRHEDDADAHHEGNRYGHHA